MKVVIMAGGKGTRMQSVATDVPKPMLKISGVPVLEREIKSLVKQGFKEIILTIGYLGNVIKDYFGDGTWLGANIDYYFEDKPLGNAGALFKIRGKLGTEPFFLLNADSIFEVDFNRMLTFHKDHKAMVTLFSHPNNHPFDSALLVTDGEKKVVKWISREDEHPKYYKNRVNAGIHIIDPRVIDDININDIKERKNFKEGDDLKIDLDRDILKSLVGTGKMFCYDSPEYVKDMGTPERFKQVENDFKSGIIEKKSLLNKQNAVFLDRDGTINKYVGFLRKTEEFELIDGVAESIKKINDSGLLCIVVTNQPVIARGEVTVEKLEEIHNKMETLLGKEGAYVDAIYYCPHHPDKGFEGEIPELKIECNCRKPKPGMLLKASEDFNIDLSKSIMIGDGENDVKAGIAAGCKSVLLNKDGDKAEIDGKMVEVFCSLKNCIDKVLNNIC